MTIKFLVESTPSPRRSSSALRKIAVAPSVCKTSGGFLAMSTPFPRGRAESTNLLKSANIQSGSYL